MNRTYDLPEIPQQPGNLPRVIIKAMSLTDDDITQVRDVVIDAIQAVVMPHFERLETDVAEVKEEVAALKTEMREVKEDVRTLKHETLDVKDSLGRLEGRVEAMEADIKELYAMVAAQEPVYADKKSPNLSVEQKMLRMYEEIMLLAQETGVTLPN